VVTFYENSRSVCARGQGVTAKTADLSSADDRRQIEHIAEVGVFLLPFSVGLDFSLAQLGRLGRNLVVGGSVQRLNWLHLAGLLQNSAASDPSLLSVHPTRRFQVSFRGASFRCVTREHSRSSPSQVAIQIAADGCISASPPPGFLPVVGELCRGRFGPSKLSMLTKRMFFRATLPEPHSTV
jgi:hypothetical protein